MPTPPDANAANSDSLAAKTALQAAANAAFIDQATIAIANATSQGLYQIVLITFENCDIVGLQTYFIGLGYEVDYPDALNANLNPFNPAQLFGQELEDFFNNNITKITNPTRIRLEWSIP